MYRVFRPPDVRMDLVGQACATLTPIIASRMRQLQTGQVLEVISDDPTARRAWRPGRG